MSIISFAGTLRGKLLLMLLGCIVVPGCVVSVMAWMQQDALRGLIREHRLIRLKDVIATEEAHLMGSVLSVLDGARRLWQKTGEGDSCGSIAGGGLLTDSEYLSVGVVGPQSQLCVLSGGGIGEGVRQVMTEGLGSGRTLVHDLADRDGRPLLVVTKPFKHGMAGGRHVAFAVIDAASVRKSIAGFLNSTVKAWVVLDRAGRVLRSYNYGENRGYRPEAVPPDWQHIVVETTADGALRAAGDLERSRHETLVLTAYFPPLESIADGALQRLGLIVAWSLGLGVAFSIGIWFFVFWHLSRGVSATLQMIDRISPPMADGKNLEHEYPSEFDRLQHRLADLDESLRSYRGTVSREGERLGGQVEILRKVARRTRLEDTLADLCHFVEEQIEDARCSVLILDRSGRTVCSSVAPSLPEHYNGALIGLKIGPDVGSCGAAMSTRIPVFVSDIGTHPNWAPFRELALPCGLRACWSLPAIRHDGRVMGAFAIYKLAPGTPSEDEVKIAQMGVELALLAIDQAETQDLLVRQALRDELTGLPNRRYLYDWLERKIGIGGERTTQGGCAALLLDLDEFKPVNDTYGHSTGDTVLRVVGNRLSQMLRRGDVAARLGGDEFAIVLDGVDLTRDTVAKLGERVIESVIDPICLKNGITVRVSCSIGIAMFPADAESATKLLDRADEAMYVAKEQGKNRCIFWQDTVDVDESCRARK